MGKEGGVLKYEILYGASVPSYLFLLKCFIAHAIIHDMGVGNNASYV